MKYIDCPFCSKQLLVDFFSASCNNHIYEITFALSNDFENKIQYCLWSNNSITCKLHYHKNKTFVYLSKIPLRIIFTCDSIVNLTPENFDQKLKTLTTLR